MAASLGQTKRQASSDNSSAAPILSTANGSVLPEELLYEILVRMPAKPLCRLRAICRAWRSLLSDSFFVAAHSARHGPLVAAFKREAVGIDILDMSGQTVRQIPFEDCPHHRYAIVACTNLDLFCFISRDGRPRVLDPATGAVSLVSHDHAEFYHNSRDTSLAFGRLPSTGETKVLAITLEHRNPARSCKILTLGGAGKWRKTGCPSSSFTTFPRSTALVKGVLYFLGYTGSRFDHIAAYDLDMEKWRPDLLYLPLSMSIQRPVTLVELSDCLVAVDYRPTKSNASIDLWFLTDTEKVLWSKRHTVTIPYQSCSSPCDASHGYPLWVLDDGKIVFWISHYWIFDRTHRVHSLWVYDPRTNICTGSVEMPCYAFAGVYKGSLLAGLPWIKN